MTAQVSLSGVDLIVFAAYLFATVALGFWVARRGEKTGNKP